MKNKKILNEGLNEITRLMSYDRSQPSKLSEGFFDRKEKISIVFKIYKSADGYNTIYIQDDNFPSDKVATKLMGILSDKFIAKWEKPRNLIISDSDLGKIFEYLTGIGLTRHDYKKQWTPLLRKGPSLIVFKGKLSIKDLETNES